MLMEVKGSCSPSLATLAIDRLLIVINSTAAIMLYEYSSRRPLLHVSDKASIAKGGQHPSCPRRKVDDELQLGLLVVPCLLLVNSTSTKQII